ncbi:TonB-dependent receptor plug domain-containing protein [Roseateles violae]|uniref:TonB-dependent receptor n=1 Tax=Roseateles violae TaxID=3058042 RepID=A0ABT8DRX4_9BURK|nr:TonB-dependent receptor [Pelomonas sp. PFR6]MDN3918886.1 TonB-dependent receptor [Pelomonas sp. PFR6]
MFKLNALSLAVVASLSAMPALAQQQAENQLERVTVTGSAIKRLDAETAVPVTVFKMTDMKQQGLTTVEQIMSTLTASQASLGTSQAVGSSTGGASFADLRGIGANKTLVLLNGRRIANNAFDGSAPDLNMIPIAAIERIEVLRDGASSLYGTDAIGGVINFITRKDYVGGTVSAQYEVPEHGGGKGGQVNGGFGFGDLDKQGFNVFGFVDFQKQDNISGSQRPFNTRYAGGLSGSPMPGNYYQDPNVWYNPAAPDCTNGVFIIPAGDGTSCYMTTSNFVDYIPKSERASAMVKGELKLGADHVLGAEYFITRSNVKTLIAPVPYGFLPMNRLRPDGTPNPYYPNNPALSPTFDDGLVGETMTEGGALIAPGYVIARWRDMPNGQRGDSNTNKQQRLVLSLDGTVAGWDYAVGLSQNQNKVDEELISGYSNGPMIYEGVLTGVINPFGEQSAAGQTLLNNAGATGLIMYAKGTTTIFDARVSRELGDWFGAGRGAGLAIGTEFRKEKFTQQANPDYATIVVDSTGIDPATYSAGSRKVSALYGELNVPLMKSLDVTAAVRYDDYNDFGSTTNPKFSFRFQPSKEWLLRGSYSTGFRAPSLYELNAAQTYTNSGTVNDPLLCPTGSGSPAVCKAQFMVLNGGNTELKPEESKTATLGLLVQPVADLSLGMDFWWLKVENLIGVIGDDSLFDPANYNNFSQYYHRNPQGQLSTNGNQCPGANCGYVDVRQQNLGGINTNGIDLTGNYRLRSAYGTWTFGLNSTYVNKYEYQDFQNGPWNQNVGVYSGAGPVFRWQHTLTAVWAKDQFTAGATAYYKSGYIDSDPTNKVSDYATLDLFGTWRPVKGAALTLGVRNATDRDPPLSYQTQVFQAGYDPRFTSPIGRSYYVRGSYDF